MNEVKDTYEIDIVRLIRSMVKNWWVMLIPALIFALLVYSYIFLYIPDQYRATVPVYIKTDKGASSGYTELTTARETVEDYNILLKNNETAAMILRDLESEGGLNGSYTASQISNMLSVSHKSGSSWIGISVTCKDSLDASRILNMAIQVLKRLSGSEYYNFPSTLEYNEEAMADGYAPKISKNLMRNTTIGFLIGFMLGLIVIVARELFDDKIQSEDWIKQTFKDEIPLLAVIPSADRTDHKYGYNRYSSYYRHYATDAKKTKR